MTFESQPTRPLVRSSQNKMVAGVCAGVAEYSNLDVNLVRALTVVGALISFGTVALVYIAAWMLMPQA